MRKWSIKGDDGLEIWMMAEKKMEKEKKGGVKRESRKWMDAMEEEEEEEKLKEKESEGKFREKNGMEGGWGYFSKGDRK